MRNAWSGSSAKPKPSANATRDIATPTQADVANEFFKLAERLKVEPEKGPTRPHKPHPPHPWHKSKPRDRERAAAELKKEAREGNRAA